MFNMCFYCTILHFNSTAKLSLVLLTNAQLGVIGLFTFIISIIRSMPIGSYIVITGIHKSGKTKRALHYFISSSFSSFHIKEAPLEFCVTIRSSRQ